MRPPVAASCLARMASTTARLGERFAGLECSLLLGLVVVDVEAQDVAVLDGVGDGVGVQLLLEEVLRGFERLDVAFDALVAGVLLEDGRAGEAEELGVGEELLDGLVVVAELRAVALVEDEDHALVAERFEEVLVGRQALLFPALVSLAVFVEREAELLDGGDDDLVGGVVGKQAVDEGSVLVFSSTQPSWKRLNSSRVWRSRSLRSTTKRHLSMVGLALSSVEALKLVSVLPLPVVCQT